MGQVPRRQKRLPVPAHRQVADAGGVDRDLPGVDRRRTTRRCASASRFIHESIGTDAIVERYIDGRELYVGVLGNDRLRVLPVWEMNFAQMPDRAHRIASERVKWNDAYREKYGIMTGPADLPAETGSAGPASLPSASSERST